MNVSDRIAAVTFVAVGCLLLVAGCASVDLPPEELAKLGRFESYPARPHMRGVVVGVPHADLAPTAIAVARTFHDTVGGGVVLAHGFMREHGINVTLPAEGRTALYRDLAHTPRAGAVYREYVRAVRYAAGGGTGLYVELREATASAGDVQVVSVGISPDEAARIKKLALGKVSVRIEPLDTLTYDPWGTRHNGVLLIPPKGLSIQLSDDSVSRAQEVTSWLADVVGALGSIAPEAMSRPPILDRGRFSAVRRAGDVVVAAPHGSGDWQSDYVARLIAEWLNASLVIAHGFMGTKELNWSDRIAVNRPLEGPGMHSEDRFTPDAEIVYRAYVDHVKQAAGWPPTLYIEVHTNDHLNARGAIEIATVGISNAEALRIKGLYHEVARQVLGVQPRVELRIEGADSVFMNAYGAKLVGVLREVPRALHIEFPHRDVIRDPVTRRAYGEIMAKVLEQARALLVTPR